MLAVGCFDDVRRGLELYGDALASQLDVVLPPMPTVYCTWYHARASDEKRLAENTEFAARHLAPTV